MKLDDIDFYKSKLLKKTHSIHTKVFYVLLDNVRKQIAVLYKSRFRILAIYYLD